MIPYNKAKILIRRNVTETKLTEEVNIIDSIHRILSKNVRSKISQPRSDLSAMDGVVIFKKDIFKDRLKLVGESKAGDKFSSDFKYGEAKLIYTGAPVPGKKKTIIPKENYVLDENKNEIKIIQKTNQNFIRKEGIDFKKNQECLFKNSIINTRSIALAKSMKIKKVKVKKKPEIFVIVTGDELISKNNKIGLIESSNEILISFLIQKFGGKVKKIFTVKDNVEDFQNIYNSLDYFDLLITSGGISRGKYDIVKKVLVKNNLEIFFDRIAIKPGKPTTFGKFNENKYFLGLPGNPVSCFISMLLFFSNFTNSFFGTNFLNLHQRKLISKNQIKGNDSLTTFLRIKTNNKFSTFSVFSKQDSSLQKILNESDGIIIRKPNARLIKKGELVDVILFKDILNTEI
tara:strand:+ start:899 stop:2104 length:1206 start_codon:yes stop_codon:yes gene_type:complete